MCGTQSMPWSWPWMLELAPAGDGDSQAHGKMPSSAIPQCCPRIKERSCPLSNRVNTAQSSWGKEGILCAQASSHSLH